MSRTTGYTCCALANLLIENKITQTGVIPPEIVAGEKSNYDYVLDYLRSKGVIINMQVRHGKS
jgi:lysine 6-dehydrogenase